MANCKGSFKTKQKILHLHAESMCTNGNGIESGHTHTHTQPSVASKFQTTQYYTHKSTSNNANVRQSVKNMTNRQ